MPKKTSLGMGSEPNVDCNSSYHYRPTVHLYLKLPLIIAISVTYAPMLIHEYDICTTIHNIFCCCVHMIWCSYNSSFSQHLPVARPCSWTTGYKKMPRRKQWIRAPYYYSYARERQIKPSDLYCDSITYMTQDSLQSHRQHSSCITLNLLYHV